MIEFDNDERGKFAYVVCDCCNIDSDRFINIDGEELCEDCFMDMLPQMITYTPDYEEITKYLYQDEWLDEDDLHEYFFSNSQTDFEILEERAQREYDIEYDR